MAFYQSFMTAIFEKRQDNDFGISVALTHGDLDIHRLFQIVRELERFKHSCTTTRNFRQRLKDDEKAT